MRLTRAALALFTGTALAGSVAGCSDDRDPALLAALGDATAPALFAPAYDGNEPRSFTVNAYDDSVTLDYGSGFTPNLTLRKAPTGDLCDERAPDWDRCTQIDDDAARLSFEEMAAVVVRRDGTEMLWSNLSFEVPDEDFASEEEMLAAIKAKVTSFVVAARAADKLTPEAFVDEVPRGSVRTD